MGWRELMQAELDRIAKQREAAKELMRHLDREEEYTRQQMAKMEELTK